MVETVNMGFVQNQIFEVVIVSLPHKIYEIATHSKGLMASVWHILYIQIDRIFGEVGCLVDSFVLLADEDPSGTKQLHHVIF